MTSAVFFTAIYTVTVPSLIRLKPQKSVGNTEFSGLFGALTVLFCNINVTHDGKEVQHYDSQPNSTGQPLRYYSSPVMAIEVTPTHDDQTFTSVVIVHSHFLRWQL